MAITKIQSESLNLSDTYDFTGTVTGAGGVNTPAFEAKPGSITDIGYTGVWTKINYDTETFDLSASDYIEIYAKIENSDGGRVIHGNASNQKFTTFGAYKIIE